MCPCEVYYSGLIKERRRGVGFVVGEKLRRRLLTFTAMDERLTTTLICAHVLAEENDDMTKDAFYERL